MFGPFIVAAILLCVLGAQDPQDRFEPQAIAKKQCEGTCKWQVVVDETQPLGRGWALVSSDCAAVYSCGCVSPNMRPPIESHTGDIFFTSCTVMSPPSTLGCDSSCSWIWDESIEDWVDNNQGDCTNNCVCRKPSILSMYIPWNGTEPIGIGYELGSDGNMVLKPDQLHITVKCVQPNIQ